MKYVCCAVELVVEAVMSECSTVVPAAVGGTFLGLIILAVLGLFLWRYLNRVSSDIMESK